ncbi:C40 family peptidase [Pollutimonas nitritireducens]|uniref:C40 family peptidase n=1 Tax=Pollutimonas nitritireducens TaxID=2045209 RepID=UPI003F71FC23
MLSISHKFSSKSTHAAKSLFKRKRKTTMPPSLTSLLSTFNSTENLWRGAKCCLLVTVVSLAGCATNAQNQQALSDPAHTARDNYLSYTQSDPLGAYLAGKPQPYRSSPKTTKTLATAALNMLGIKYRFGGETPNTGFDCSGLVSYAAEKSLGLKLPRSSAEMAREGKSIKTNELKKGDLVFFNTRGHRYSHVGIYLGDKKFVHAPRSGAVVRIESMDIAYWKKRYNGARRLAANTTSSSLATAN